jgi:hypothetical protein
MMFRAHPTLAACTGLVVAPALWALNMQAGQILPYDDCASGMHLSGIVPLVSVLVASGSALVSWRAGTPPKMEEGAARPLRFVATLSTLAALLFAFALLLQGAAGLMLTGCER